jgi:hypothetical protein
MSGLACGKLVDSRCQGFAYLEYESGYSGDGQIAGDDTDSDDPTCDAKWFHGHTLPHAWIAVLIEKTGRIIDGTDGR